MHIQKIVTREANYYTQNGLTTNSYCSIENYRQYAVINQKGKEYEKNAYIHKT